MNPNLMKDNVFSIRDGGVSQGERFVRYGGRGRRRTVVDERFVRRLVRSEHAEYRIEQRGIHRSNYGYSVGRIRRPDERRRQGKDAQGQKRLIRRLYDEPQNQAVFAEQRFRPGEGSRFAECRAGAYARDRQPGFAVHDLPAERNRAELCARFQAGSTPLNFSVGLTGNLGGMNTKGRPGRADRRSGKKAHDNALRFNTLLDWLLNKSWITNVAVTASVNYADMLSKYHLPVHTASEQPAVNATTEGYFVANQLPVNYVNTQFIDSKELDYGISLKANWSRRFDRLLNRVKAGVTWSANGNVGQGEYYENPQLQPNGFRPRPYTDIPYMHNLAVYLEDNLTLQLGQTSLGVMAGVRGEDPDQEHAVQQGTEPVAAIQCEIYADQSRTEIFF